MIYFGGVLLALIIALAIWFIASLQPVDRSNGAYVEVDVPEGASIQQVASTLKVKNLIKSNLVFMIIAKLGSTHIAAGMHEISPSMSTPDIIYRLSSASQSSFQITILPEMTIPDIKELFRKYDFTNAEIEQALSKKYTHPLLASKPDELDLEGYIFPDTYELLRKDSLETLLNMTFDNLYTQLESDGSLEQIAARGLTIHQALTLASIVGKEAPDDEDQKIIAGVFWNRLNSNIPLGSDVTFKYAYKMGYCREDSPSCSSAWNTRIHSGLPPGPIANMKYSTIKTVLEPTNSGFYYFVAGDDGTIYYAADEAAHQENIYLYCTVQCQ
jgi:UPF0755 protein